MQLKERRLIASCLGLAWEDGPEPPPGLATKNRLQLYRLNPTAFRMAMAGWLRRTEEPATPAYDAIWRATPSGILAAGFADRCTAAQMIDQDLADAELED